MPLGVLIGHFRALVRLRHRAAPAEGGPPAPEIPARGPALARLYDRLGHHLVLLTLIARSDGEFVAEERAVIVRHCAELGGLTDAECARLDAHLTHSEPSPHQRDMALKRLESEAHPDLEALIDAAEGVIMADGRLHPREMRLLEHIRGELKALRS